jgi:hypothetical protein
MPKCYDRKIQKHSNKIMIEKCCLFQTHKKNIHVTRLRVEGD